MPLRKTLRYTRQTFGDDGQNGERNILSLSFYANDLKRPAVASGTSLLAASAVSNAAATVLTPTSAFLDVPRNVTLTLTGTAASVAATPITVTGRNSEGKVITDTVTPTAGTLGTLSTTQAFRVVTSVSVPQQTGAGVNVSVGHGNLIGLGYRNLSTTQIKLYKVTAAGTKSLVDPAATVFSSTLLENNTVQLDVNPNGTNMYRVYAYFTNWHLNPVNDNPNYGL